MTPRAPGPDGGSAPDASPPWSGVLADVAAAAGDEAAVAVGLAFGGTWIHFPKRRRLESVPQHGLAAVVGLERALRIADRVGGSSAYVPLDRRACAVRMAARGHTHDDIAARLRVRPHDVRRLLRPHAGP